MNDIRLEEEVRERTAELRQTVRELRKELEDLQNELEASRAEVERYRKALEGAGAAIAIVTRDYGFREDVCNGLVLAENEIQAALKEGE